MNRKRNSASSNLLPTSSSTLLDSRYGYDEGSPYQQIQVTDLDPSTLTDTLTVTLWATGADARYYYEDCTTEYTLSG